MKANIPNVSKGLCDLTPAFFLSDHLPLCVLVTLASLQVLIPIYKLLLRCLASNSQHVGTLIHTRTQAFPREALHHLSDPGSNAFPSGESPHTRLACLLL